jgi:hypothetical protein
LAAVLVVAAVAWVELALALLEGLLLCPMASNAAIYLLATDCMRSQLDPPRRKV